MGILEIPSEISNHIYHFLYKPEISIYLTNHSVHQGYKKYLEYLRINNNLHKQIIENRQCFGSVDLSTISRGDLIIRCHQSKSLNSSFCSLCGFTVFRSRN